nr:hypothetical protein [Tanacetum cinerariifolium]
MIIAEYIKYEAEMKWHPWGASVNVMPKSLFEHLKIADLKETSMMVEMVDMTKKDPLGIMENILVKIDKFLFHSNFVVIDMLEGPNKTMLLGKPFLPTIHAQIDVFRNEIWLRIGSKEDKVRSHPFENVVSRWHVCKPVRVTIKDCEKDCGKWPTCNLDFSFCSGYHAIYGKDKSGMLKYGNKNIDDVTREWLYYEWVAQNYDFNVKSRKVTKYADPYDFHHEYPHPYIPQEKSFNFEVDFERTRDDPYSRRFDVYKEKFDSDIEQLANEYDLKVGMKKYALDDIWEKCDRFQHTACQWHDEGFEEDE